MAITETKVLKQVVLNQQAQQVRVISDIVVERDGVEVYRSEEQDVYTPETATALAALPNGAEYVTLMGW